MNFLTRHKRPLAAVAALAGLAMLVVYVPVGAWLESFVTWAKSAGPWGPLALAAAYVPATILMVPGTVLTLGAGFAFGLAIGTLTVSVGSVAGSVAAFFLGRTILRSWVADKLEERPRLKAIDEAVGNQGLKIVTLIRLSPAFPYNLMGYVFGVTRVRSRDHILGSWIGMLPGTAMYVYLGHAARQAHDVSMGHGASRTPLEWTLLGVGLVATVAVTILVTRTARRAIRDAVPETQQDALVPEGSPA